MKNTMKCLGIIALVAVIGFSMVACGGDDPEPNYAKLIVTNSSDRFVVRVSSGNWQVYENIASDESKTLTTPFLSETKEIGVWYQSGGGETPRQVSVNFEEGKTSKVTLKRTDDETNIELVFNGIE